MGGTGIQGCVFTQGLVLLQGWVLVLPQPLTGWVLHILGFSATRQGCCSKSDPLKLNFEQLIEQKVSLRPARACNKSSHKKQPDEQLIKATK